mgnify:CR=1 FL=1
MGIHTFGCYFGLAVAYMIYENAQSESKAEGKN